MASVCQCSYLSKASRTISGEKPRLNIYIYSARAQPVVTKLASTQCHLLTLTSSGRAAQQKIKPARPKETSLWAGLAQAGRPISRPAIQQLATRIKLIFSEKYLNKYFNIALSSCYAIILEENFFSLRQIFLNLKRSELIQYSHLENCNCQM